MSVKLPPPKKIKLANGKWRTLYFGFDGKFVSKATYEELVGKTGRPPQSRKRAARAARPTPRKTPKSKSSTGSQRAPRPAAPLPEPEMAVPFPEEQPIEIPLNDGLILKRLVWPPKEPPLVIDVPPSMAGLMPDFLGIRQLSVQKRVYEVKPLVGDVLVQLRPRQHYWIAPLEGAEHGELALVRGQAQPDQAEQFVVMSESTARRVWIDKAEATDNFTHIHVLGTEREWSISDLSPEHLNLNEPRIIGIIEAILIPADDKGT